MHCKGTQTNVKIPDFNLPRFCCVAATRSCHMQALLCSHAVADPQAAEHSVLRVSWSQPIIPTKPRRRHHALPQVRGLLQE
jgi:hypothetical protein